MRENRLEFSDWPMFDRVMSDEELCRGILEAILASPVSRIEYVVTEHELRPSFASRGVRLDAFVKAEGEIYDIEMQTTNKGQLGRRLRYYQGSIDTLSLNRGAEYRSLPPCFIIFICTCDPFGRGLPVYTWDVRCLEDGEVPLGHGFTWIVLSAPAWSSLPEGPLRNLLHYTMTGDAGDDSLALRIEAAVARANDDEEWRREKVQMLTFEEDMEIQMRIAIDEGLEKGMQEGLQKGMQKGMQEGMQKGENLMGELVAALLAEGRTDDAYRAATDPAVRAQFFQEFNLAC